MTGLLQPVAQVFMLLSVLIGNKLLKDFEVFG